jgi:hypothetical protein
MFRHFYIIIREFYICALLSYIKFLKLNLSKLQFHKIIEILFSLGACLAQ